MRIFVIIFIFLSLFFECNPYGLYDFIENAWNGTTITTIPKGSFIVQSSKKNSIKLYNHRNNSFDKKYRPLTNGLEFVDRKVDFVDLKNKQKIGSLLTQDAFFKERKPLCFERLFLIGASFATIAGIYLSQKAFRKIKKCVK